MPIDACGCTDLTALSLSKPGINGSPGTDGKAMGSLLFSDDWNVTELMASNVHVSDWEYRYEIALSSVMNAWFCMFPFLFFFSATPSGPTYAQ